MKHLFMISISFAHMHIFFHITGPPKEKNESYDNILQYNKFTNIIMMMIYTISGVVHKLIPSHLPSRALSAMDTISFGEFVP